MRGCCASLLCLRLVVQFSCLISCLLLARAPLRQSWSRAPRLGRGAGRPSRRTSTTARTLRRLGRLLLRPWVPPLSCARHGRYPGLPGRGLPARLCRRSGMAGCCLLRRLCLGHRFRARLGRGRLRCWRSIGRRGLRPGHRDGMLALRRVCLPGPRLGRLPGLLTATTEAAAWPGQLGRLARCDPRLGLARITVPRRSARGSRRGAAPGARPPTRAMGLRCSRSASTAPAPSTVQRTARPGAMARAMAMAGMLAGGPAPRRVRRRTS